MKQSLQRLKFSQASRQIASTPVSRKGCLFSQNKSRTLFLSTRKLNLSEIFNFFFYLNWIGRIDVFKNHLKQPTLESRNLAHKTTEWSYLPSSTGRTVNCMSTCAFSQPQWQSTVSSSKPIQCPADAAHLFSTGSSLMHHRWSYAVDHIRFWKCVMRSDWKVLKSNSIYCLQLLMCC